MSLFRSIILGGFTIAFLGCAHTASEQPNVSAQPPAEEQQSGAVSLLKKATALLLENKSEEAIAVYKETIARFPKEPDAYAALITHYNHRNQFEKALQTAILFRTEFPHSPQPIINQALTLERSNKIKETEEISRYGLEKFPENSDLLVGLAVSIRKQNRFEEATKLLESKIAESDDWDARVYYFLSQFLILDADKNGSDQIAIANRAIELLNKSIEKDPNNVNYLYSRAELEMFISDFPAAIADYEKVDTLQNGNIKVIESKLIPLYIAQKQFDDAFERIKFLKTINYENVASVYQFLIQEMLADQELEKAAEIAKEGINVFPNDTAAETLYAQVLLALEKFDVAEILLKEARRKLYEREPNSFDPYLELYYGISLVRQNKVAEGTEILTELAAQDFDNALQSYFLLLSIWQNDENTDQFISILKEIEKSVPHRPFVPLFIADSEMKNQNYAAAADAFDRAEKNMLDYPDNPNSFLTANFYYQFAFSKERIKQYEDAEALFKKSIELFPNNVLALNHLAYMWSELGTNLDEAETMAKKALELDPNSGAILDTLGWIYFKQGKYQEAMPLLLRASELTPNDTTILDHIGDCAMKLGKTDDAVSYWKKSVEISPNEQIQQKIDNQN